MLRKQWRINLIGYAARYVYRIINKREQKIKKRREEPKDKIYLKYRGRPARKTRTRKIIRQSCAL